MSKAYWRSAGSGALGLSGPWQTAVQPTGGKPASAFGRIGRTLITGYLLAFSAGMAISVDRAFGWGPSDPAAIGYVAFLAVGRFIDGATAWVIRLLSLSNHAAMTVKSVLVALDMPFRLAAFAGAYITTFGLEFLKHATVVVVTRL
jgi:hypothetical protein